MTLPFSQPAVTKPDHFSGNHKQTIRIYLFCLVCVPCAAPVMWCEFSSARIKFRSAYREDETNVPQHNSNSSKIKIKTKAQKWSSFECKHFLVLWKYICYWIVVLVGNMTIIVIIIIHCWFLSSFPFFCPFLSFIICHQLPLSRLIWIETENE